MAGKRAAARRAPPFIDPPGYARHRPEETLLCRLVEQHYPAFLAARAAAGRPLPKYVQEEFEAYLKCGRLEHGFLRVRCEGCHAEKLVAFSCKRRGFCPSCGARRMVESAALLADEVLPPRPLRQWVLSLPFALRFLLATDPQALRHVLGIVYRTLSAHLLKKARLTRVTGATGAVTLIQRLSSALNLNIHFHMLERCRRCGGRLQVIASIKDPALIQRILTHLKQPAAHAPPRSALGARPARAAAAVAVLKPLPAPAACAPGSTRGTAAPHAATRE